MSKEKGPELLEKYIGRVRRGIKSKKTERREKFKKHAEVLELLTPIEEKTRGHERAGEVYRELLRRKKIGEQLAPGVQAARRLARQLGAPVKQTDDPLFRSAKQPVETEEGSSLRFDARTGGVTRGLTSFPQTSLRYKKPITPTRTPTPFPEQARKEIARRIREMRKKGTYDPEKVALAARKALESVSVPLSLFNRTAIGQAAFADRMLGTGEMASAPGQPVESEDARHADNLKQAFLKLRSKPSRELMGAAREMLEKRGFGLLLQDKSKEETDRLLLSTAEGIVDDFYDGRYDKEYSEDAKAIINPYLKKLGAYRLASDKTVEDERRASLEGKSLDRYGVDEEAPSKGGAGKAAVGFLSGGPVGALGTYLLGTPVARAGEGIAQGVYRSLPTDWTGFQSGFFDRSEDAGSAAFAQALVAEKKRVGKRGKDSLPLNFAKNIGEMVVGLGQLIWETYGLLGDDVPEIVKRSVIADMRNRGVFRPLTAKEYDLMRSGKRADTVRNMVQAMGASIYNTATNPVEAFESDPLFTLMTFTGAARALKMSPVLKSHLQKKMVTAPNKPYVPEAMRGKQVSRYELITGVLNQVDGALMFAPVKIAAQALPGYQLAGPVLQQVGAAMAPVGSFLKDFLVRPTSPIYRVVNELQAVGDASPVYKEQMAKLRQSTSSDMPLSTIFEKMDELLDPPLKEAYAEVMLRELGLKDAAVSAERAGRSLFETLKAEQAMRLGDETPARGPETARGEPFPAPRATPDPFAPAKKAAEESVVSSALREVRRLAETLEARLKDPNDTFNATRRDRAFEQGLSDLVKEDIKVRVDAQAGTLLEKEARLKNELVSYVESVKQKIQREGGSLEGEFTQALNAAAEQKGWPEVLRMLKGGDDPLGGSFARSVAKRRGQKALNLEDPPASVPGQEPPVATPSPVAVPRDVSPVAPDVAPVPDAPSLPTPETPTPAAPVAATADVAPTPGAARLADEGYFEDLLRLEDDVDVARSTSETVPRLEESYNRFVRNLAETKGDAPHVFVLEASDATSGLLQSLKDTLRDLVIKDLEPTIKSESQRRRMNLEYIEKLVEKDMGEARGALYKEVLDADGNLQFIEGTGHSKPGKPRFDPGRPKVDTEVISQSDLPVLILEDGQVRAPGLHTSAYGMRIKRATGKVDEGITGERQAIAHVIAGLESGKPFKVAAASANTARYLESLSVPKGNVPGGGLGTVMGSDGLIGALMQGRQRALDAGEAVRGFFLGQKQKVSVSPEVEAAIRNPQTRAQGLAQLIDDTDVVATNIVTRERRLILEEEIANSAAGLQPRAGQFEGQVTAATDATLAGRSPEDFGLRAATAEQKKWLGFDEASNLYIQPEVQNFIKWDQRWRATFGGGTAGKGLLKVASSSWKAMMTAMNPITFAGNFISNLALRAMVDGNVTPIGLLEATGVYNRYKSGALQRQITQARKQKNNALAEKLELDMAMIKEWEKAGWGDFTSVEVRQALGKGVADKFGKWLAEASDADAAQAFSRVMQGTATAADNLLVRTASKGLNLWKGALTKMETAYRLSDVWFKLERGLIVGRLLDKGLKTMGKQKTLTFDVSPERSMTIYKDINGNLRLNNQRGRKLSPKQVSSLLAEAGRLAGNRLYFDYSKVSGLNRLLRESGADVFASPFYSWFWKAMWVPGLKEGLAKHIINGGLSGIKSTDPNVTKLIGAGKARQARGRLGVVLSSQMARQLPESEVDKLRMLSGYGPTKDSPFMGLLIKGPGGMTRFMMNRFEVSGAQLPFNRLLGKVTMSLRGKEAAGSMLDGSIQDFIIEGSPQRAALDSIIAAKVKGGPKLDADDRRDRTGKFLRLKRIVDAARTLADPEKRLKIVEEVRSALPSLGNTSSDLAVIFGLQAGGAGPLIAETVRSWGPSSNAILSPYLMAQLIGMATGSKMIGDIATKTFKDGGNVTQAVREYAGIRDDSYLRKEDQFDVQNYVNKSLDKLASEWKNSLRTPTYTPRTDKDRVDLEAIKRRNLTVDWAVDAEIELLRMGIKRELESLGYEPASKKEVAILPQKSTRELDREAMRELNERWAKRK